MTTQRVRVMWTSRLPEVSSGRRIPKNKRRSFVALLLRMTASRWAVFLPYVRRHGSFEPLCIAIDRRRHRASSEESRVPAPPTPSAMGPPRRCARDDRSKLRGKAGPSAPLGMTSCSQKGPERRAPVGWSVSGAWMGTARVMRVPRPGREWTSKRAASP